MFDTQRFGDHLLLAEDVPLAREAFRRVRAAMAAGPSDDAVMRAIVDELRQGQRNLYALFKAGRRAGGR